MSEIKDFSKKRKRLQFRIDDDVFEAAPAIPASVMTDFVEKFTGVDPTSMTVDKQLAVFHEVLEVVLLPESMERLAQRMRDTANPVDFEQLDAVITWLFEEYGMRPTNASETSSNGDAALMPGTTSTESTPQAELISSASL